MACQMFIITTHAICHDQPEVGCQIMADHAVVFRAFANCLHSVKWKLYWPLQTLQNPCLIQQFFKSIVSKWKRWVYNLSGGECNLNLY